MNVKDFSPNSSGDPVGFWEAGVDDQGVVVFLVRRKHNFDEVLVCPRVLGQELLDFLYERHRFRLDG